MKIGIIGGGNMGAALIAGMYKAFRVCVCEQDKTRAAALKRKYKICMCDPAFLARTCDVIILAVKPQGMEDVVTELAAFLKAKTLVVSIAAGITTKFLEKRLPARTRVVRTMPNMPAQIGKGLTGISKGKYATAKDMKTVRAVFDCVGKTMIIKENMMDAFTAVAGSGPAYLFYVAECMTDGAKALGFSREQAAQIVSQVVTGSIIQLAQAVEAKTDTAESLRKKVTSRGGTTEAAMKVFEQAKTNKIFKTAMTAAKKRSKVLAR